MEVFKGEKWMRYWILDCDVDNYENIMCEGDVDLAFINSFNGESKLETWKSPKFKRMYNRKYSNTPGFASHIPVFDEKTVMVLSGLLEDNVEILPIMCNDKKFYLINIIKIQDCIDYEKSQYKMFRDGKRIMKFSKYVFDRNKIKNCGDIFKLFDEPSKRPFVSDNFRNKVIENNLVGFKFELAWDSELDN